MPEVFQERRQQRPFRIIHIPLDAFVLRFILQRKEAESAPPVQRPPDPPPSPSEKAVPWKCGVPQLDEQYEAVFKAIRQYQGAFKSGAELADMKKRLESLEHSVESHLALEEAYLEHLGFPGRNEHLRGHRAFRHQLQALSSRLKNGDPGAGMELSQLLFTWLKRHVMREDAAWVDYAKMPHDPPGQVQA